MDKKLELTHLERFIEICNFFPTGKVECTERPDFIISNKGKTFGIEHTQIFQPGPSDGSSLQAQDALAQKIVSKASNLYCQSLNKPLFVQILFYEGKLIKKQDINNIAERIYQIIEREHVPPGQILTIERSYKNYKYFPPEIGQIHIYSDPNLKENFWRCSSVGFIPELTAHQIQEKINEKEKEISSYKEKCSEIWLLIVSENLRIPTAVDISGEAIEHRYYTRFDRIFLFWVANKEYIEFLLINYSNSNN